MVALNRLFPLNQPEYNGNNGYNQQDMYESTGTVADKTNDPGNNQNNGYDIK